MQSVLHWPISWAVVVAAAATVAVVATIVVVAFAVAVCGEVSTAECIHTGMKIEVNVIARMF